MQPALSSWFLTLTYDPEHVPNDGSLDYRDFQEFIRNLRLRRRRAARKAGVTPPKIRFFMAGEYGDEGGRPHYHACIFGLALPDVRYFRRSPSGHSLFTSAELSDVWGRGFVSVGALTFESAAYTASYINKKITGKNSRDHYTRVNTETGECHTVKPEFAVMSRRPGIGQTFFGKYQDEILPRDFCRIGARKTRVPRYYRNLFKELEPFVAEALDFDRSTLAAERLARGGPSLESQHRVACARAALSTRKL